MRPLSLLWRLIDVQGAAIGTRERVDVEGARRVLVTHGLLKPASTARFVPCPSCGVAHLEEVQYRRGRGRRQAFVTCPSDGDVPIEPERLERWAPDHTAVLKSLAQAVEAAGEREELATDRFWCLGRLTLGRRMTDLFFFRGLGWDDGPTVLSGSERFASTQDRLLLIPTRISLTALPSFQDEVIVLDEGTTLEGGGIRFVTPLLPSATAPKGTPEVRSVPIPRGTAWKDLTLILEEDSLTVAVGAQRWQRSIRDSGFASSRSGRRPKTSFELLRLLATKGSIPLGGAAKTKAALAERLHRLRGALRLLVPLNEDPIRYFRKGREYRPLFSCRHARITDVNLPDVGGWRELTLMIGADAVTISIDRSDSSTSEVRHTMRAMRLVGADGEPTKAGLRLLKLAASGGRLNAPATDLGMLDLGKQLSEMFGLSAPPFAFNKDTSEWTAAFGVRQDRR